MAARHTLLHVEDDQALAFLFRRMLEREGFNYQSVPNVEMAMAYVSNCAPFNDLLQFPQPDAVITDLKLSGGPSASELIQWLRHLPRHARTPIVVLSGGGDTDSANNAMRAGANAFVLKGMSIKELVAQLQTTFREHGLQ